MTGTPDLQDRVRLAISDPGSFLPREDGETVSSWSMRAVLEVLPSGTKRLIETCNLLRDRLADTTSQRDEAQGELERLHSWAGLMELLDEHWPADIFPGPENGAEEREDDGPRVVSLIRALDKVGASRRDWAADSRPVAARDRQGAGDVRRTRHPVAVRAGEARRRRGHRCAPRQRGRPVSDWRERSECRDADPVIFFPPKGGNRTAEAKQICARCPVTAECLQVALDGRIRDGIWGGLSERDRRKLKPRAAA